MTTRQASLIALALAAMTAAWLVVACTQERLALIPASETPRTPPEIRQACSLAELKCSRCHDLERIKIAHHEMVNWPMYVEKMRRQPGSGISVEDGKVILKCLEYLTKIQREHAYLTPR